MKRRLAPIEFHVPVPRSAFLFGVPLFVFALFTVLAAQGAGPDWPQFRGPNRDGAIASFVEPKTWPDRLTQRWRVEVGEGHASPVLVGDRVYAFTRQGANEVMQALDAATGKAVWQTRYAAPVTVNPAAQANSGISLYMSNGVLVGDALFGLSHRNRGQYFLIDTKSGNTIWTGMPRAAENAAIVRAGNVVFRSRMMRNSSSDESTPARFRN